MTDDPRPKFSSRRAAAEAAAGRPQRLRASSSALRSFEPENARLDVLCRKRCIARVLDRGRLLNAAIEVHSLSGGTGGQAINLVEVATSTVLLVDCRCGRTHQLDAGKLADEAWAARPGRPRAVTASYVSVL